MLRRLVPCDNKDKALLTFFFRFNESVSVLLLCFCFLLALPGMSLFSPRLLILVLLLCTNRKRSFLPGRKLSPKKSLTFLACRSLIGLPCLSSTLKLAAAVCVSVFFLFLLHPRVKDLF